MEKNEWMCDFYSHYDNETEYHFCVGGRYECCIPYEGNEKLLGTTDEPKTKRWRAKCGKPYWLVVLWFGEPIVKLYHEHNNTTDDANFAIGNYFRSEEEAQSMAEKFKQLLKGE